MREPRSPRAPDRPPRPAATTGRRSPDDDRRTTPSSPRHQYHHPCLHGMSRRCRPACCVAFAGVDLLAWTAAERLSCRTRLAAALRAADADDALLRRTVWDVVVMCLAATVPPCTAHDILQDIYSLLFDRDARHLDVYFCTLADALCVACALASPQQLSALASLVHQLNHYKWFPAALLVEHLSYPLLDRAFVILAEKCERLENQIAAFSIYTLPQFSLASEEAEGFMNLLVALTAATTTAAPDPAHRFHHHYYNHDYYTCLLPPLIVKNTADLPPPSPSTSLLSASVDSLWRRIDDIVVSHKIMFMRVADLTLRCFARNVDTHWPLFVSLLRKFQFNDLPHVFSFILQNNLSSSSSSSSYAANASDNAIAPATAYNSHGATYCADAQSLRLRLDAALARHKGSLCDFFRAASGRSSSSQCMAQSDLRLAQRHVDAAAGALPHTTTSSLLTVAALLVTYNLMPIQAALAVLPDSNVARYRAPMRTWSADPNDASNDYLRAARGTPDNDIYAAEIDALWDESTPSAHATLLCALLSLGNLDAAFYIMHRYPDLDWCVTFPRVTLHLSRVLEFLLQEEVTSKNTKGQGETRPRERKCLFPLWKDCVRAYCDNHCGGDLLALAQRLIAVIGHALHMSPACLILIARICARKGAQTSAVEKRTLPALQAMAWSKTRLLTGYLLPCLAIMRQPPPELRQAVWSLISSWSVARRYALYEYWQQVLVRINGDVDSAAHDPSLLFTQAILHARHVARYWMKRLSKDVIKSYSRKLAKIALSTPLVLMLQIVDTVLTYENLIGPVVECLRYVEDMSYDILLYVVLRALDERLRTRGCSGGGLKLDGVNLEPWLINASRFLSILLHQHGSVEIEPLLHFLDRGREFDVAESHILSDLIQSMSGIKSIPEFSIENVRVLECGDATSWRFILGSKTTNAELADSTTRLQRGLLRGGRHLRLLRQLRMLFSRLGRESQWSDFEVVERADTGGALAALQWRDRIKSNLLQYLTFLRIFCSIPWRMSNYEAIPFTPGTKLTPGSRRALFWHLRYRHLYFDEKLYGSNEAHECEQHRLEYEEAQSALKAAGGENDDEKNREDFPSTQELVVRCLASCADAHYVALWLTHSSHAEYRAKTADALMSHVWAVAGMTENEAARFGSVVCECLDSEETHQLLFEFMSYALLRSHDHVLIRNALQVLKVVTDVFPALPRHFESLRSALKQHEKDPSLRVMILVVDGSIEATRKGRGRPSSAPSCTGNLCKRPIASKNAIDQCRTQVYGEAKRAKVAEHTDDVSVAET